MAGKIYAIYLERKYENTFYSLHVVACLRPTLTVYSVSLSLMFSGLFLWPEPESIEMGIDEACGPLCYVAYKFAV